MTLIELLQGISYTTPSDQALLEQLEITKITEDSRAVTAGTLFVALRGTQADGHRFIPSAIEAGSRAIVLETLPEELQEGVAYIVVPSSSEVLGLLSSALHGHPSRQLTVVGVTGTNGKTTIATLLFRLFRALGYRCGLLSTVCNYIEDEAISATHTTPSAPELQALLGRMRDAGCTHVFMEVSSHALAQHRVAGLHFRGGIFTNLTRDHLDYHGSVQEYLRAKKSFFDGLGKEAFALTNVDDKNGLVMLQNTQAEKYSYALRSAADYRAEILEQYPYGTQVRIDGREVLVRLVGEFNIYNLLAVYGAALLLGLAKEDVLIQLSQLTAVDGRFQSFISEKRGYIAIVDYAHTPDALANVLETIQELKGRKAEVICVVGCGGDRDRGKRPIMAQEAARRSDRVILTSDNPRSEDPQAIIAEMKAGLSPEDLSRTLSITDRAEAIRTATMLAKAGDIILIAGKGHETYQEIAGVRHHFDDREILLEQFAHEV
ncbi:UDP-N-acetylmuramoyl-L-alanyl-D-glutamate--2,6-diaminopimelate ligase [Porphyromonas sp. oral taxon 278]|uniref:UDP-N-acetylmuramoyl-L-alanyl-D-glutamate--2, 6-diaminopimelate ligase n=1 Tax=Porphyromonas sp. oral taxon 278 TaxID=712437 RepID=UPI0025D6C0D8|nr:UDP-N-acetylmuramoyl-L-alanyl-D-glutamate--2,6-diaminopimelate ligase [Porphyromonas sp. oral taxon 278]